MLLVAAVTLSLLATLTSAEIDGGLFSSCPAGAGFTDPYVMTQQFWQNGANLANGMKLIAYDGTSEDDKMSCQQMILFAVYRNITLIFTGKNQAGQTVEYVGRGASSSSDGFFPLMKLANPPPPGLAFPTLVLGSHATGLTQVYFTYVSPTEIVIRTCRGVFLGTRHSLYVFSSQVNDVATLNSTCLLNTVRSLPNNGGFKLKSTIPMSASSACT